MYKSLQHCQKQLDDIQSIDYFLARQICQSLDRSDDHLLFHSIMATSQALRHGHTCLKLTKEAGNTVWQNADENKTGYLFPKISEWDELLNSIEIGPESNHPLVYEFNRLYLRRYYQFENDLALDVYTLMNKEVLLNSDEKKINARHIIDDLFPQSESNKDELDWQKIAVANSLIQQFTIIAGGPGTGKTFTVTKILAALQSLAQNNLRIAMVAPTGKAAQRLNESIQKAKTVLLTNKLSSQETIQSIPDTASTLHRLLGVIPGNHNFRYNENRQLPFDVVLVDEISMIDLPLMTRLMRAVDSHCRIIMLGDADQLPSVAAGSVLADLAPGQAPGYSPDVSQKLSELTGFDIPTIEPANNDVLNLNHLTVLQKSHRFDSGGEISELAKQVINGHSKQSWSLLEQGKVQIERIKSDSFNHWIEARVDEYYSSLFNVGINKFSISDAFEQLNQFRFLAATRMGEQGVDNINETIEKYLLNKGLISSRNEFYPGRPIMVTENHYNVGLYNGDTGLIWINDEGKVQAVFPDNETVRWLSLGRLPKVETVYAMTIHKTQGSEFKHVGLVLPENDSLILSRELLYTGITRASKKLSVWADKGIWDIGVRRKVQRYSGLSERIFR